ncbi:PDZ and LIM domain protein 4-like [Scleropages formosus]|uniref:PDZ and LIM domain protein 4 n=1 Tax=Scleropages formosus TaxID=113540 RepID=A0A0P7WY70_SCLFO|nr:PDZ and LIM domain protein 4-like [Scleropages formosus]
MTHMVTLEGPSPWGFRLVGGRDFSAPLTVSRVTSGSKAAHANLCPGDVILAINGDRTENMTHMEAQNRIKACSEHLALAISRSEKTICSPTVFVPIGSGHHGKVAQPIQEMPVNNGSSKSPTQYNSPAGLYSNSRNGSLPKQMTNLSLGSTSPEPTTDRPGFNNGFHGESEVYRMLKDQEEPPAAPKQSGSFRYLQDMLEAEDGGLSPTDRPAAVKSVRSPIRSPVQHLGPKPSLQQLTQCTRCGNAIVGTIVKARDKLYHPDCFLCDDCGVNLKQRGYFFIEENLYCETHAKARVQPPEGYDVVAVYPNSKVELV